MVAIRIGLAAHPAAVPRWLREALETLAAGEAARVTAVLTLPSRDVEEPAPSRGFAVYERLDRQRNARDPDPLAATDASDLLTGAARVDLAAGQQPPELDIVLAPDEPGPALRAAARAARARLWTVRLGADASGRSLAHDMVARSAVYEIGVVQLEGPRGARLLARSASRMHPTSLHRNRMAAALRARRLVVRCLRDLHAGRLDEGELLGAAAPRRPPAGLALARFAAFAGAHALGGRLRRTLWREQWLLAVRRASGPPAPHDSFAADRLLVPPPEVFWADPFVLRRDGRSYVFFEEYVYATALGHISVLTLDDAGRTSAPEVVLKTGSHLSYPFVFEHAGETYLIPESAAARTVRLYRAVDFPAVWEEVAELISDTPLYDATVVRHGDRWWLFGTIGEPGERVDDELHVFGAERLEGPWEPHPRNPVVSDARCGRPAGPLFVHGGELIRPAQDCSGDYGRAVVFRRVDVLTSHDYRETTVSRIDPEWLRGNRGSHTYASDGTWEIVDARRYAPKRRRTADEETDV